MISNVWWRDLWVNQNQYNVLLFLILWKGKRKLKKKKNVFQKVVQVFHSSLNYILNMVRIWMVFWNNFNTFNSCFTTFLSSTEALHKFFEGCRLVVFSLLCNIWYLWGDGDCSKRVILRFHFTLELCLFVSVWCDVVSGFLFLTFASFFQVSSYCVSGRFCFLWMWFTTATQKQIISRL